AALGGAHRVARAATEDVRQKLPHARLVVNYQKVRHKLKDEVDSLGTLLSVAFAEVAVNDGGQISHGLIRSHLCINERGELRVNILRQSRDARVRTLETGEGRRRQPVHYLICFHLRLLGLLNISGELSLLLKDELHG